MLTHYNKSQAIFYLLFLNMKTKILDINFDVINLHDAATQIIKFLNSNQKKFIITANPEIIMHAQRDKNFKKILSHADLILPDGIGIVFASKLNKIKLSSRVTGYDLVQELFLRVNKNYKFFFLGSTHKNINLAKTNMQLKYKNLNITGTHDGYFDKTDKLINKKIIQQINFSKPDILLVGFGSPAQELWIYKNKNKINAKIFIGIGGSFDVMSGMIKRAPNIFIKLNLEWLYRLIKQPSRLIRILVLPKFIIKILYAKIISLFTHD